MPKRRQSFFRKGSNRALGVANDLTDIDHGAAGVVRREAVRFDVRVDLPPLSGPVFPYRLAATHISAFHAVGPVNLRMHRFERAIDVSIVERPVGFREDIAHR
jgi:hypothetical protein